MKKINLIDFHAHLHLHLDVIGKSSDACIKENCRAMIDPLRPFFLRVMWAPYEKLGYRYFIRGNSPLVKPMERILARVLRGVPSQNENSLVAEMDRQKIDYSVVLALPPFAPNNQILECCRKQPRLIPFLMPERNVGAAARQISDFAGKGAKGIKLHPLLQSLAPDDEFCIESAQAAGSHGLPLVIHAGGSGLLFGKTCVPEFNVSAFGRLLAAAPQTRIVIAHSGLWEYSEIIEVVRRYKNAWLDISFQHTEVMAKVIDAVGYQRVLFGSDSPIGKQEIILKNFRALNLHETESRAILAENALKLLNMD
ncbi:MAG: amidohydrolase family protein [Candidatus Riflebacteria bacterium]|nr:amidohydrolase family protein [Candidatus Riflebacteria bacterium]